MGADATLPPTTACAGSGGGGVDGAATKLQKTYRSYQTRRKLADSAVVVEQLWWRALEFARLNHSTISFFNQARTKTTTSLWSRARFNASKVGQGLSREAKARKQAFEHWIEAIDPRHRSGRNLHCYYDVWCQSQAGQPFFYWLDVGEGKDIDLPECPRTLLKKQCVKYLGPQERKLYEYIVNGGKIIHKQSGEPLDTSQDPKGAKWIFVMSTDKKIYCGKKERGIFQHSSFLAGGATIAAGRFTASNGVIKSIWSYSGHYKPSLENISNFMNFLEDNGVDVRGVEVFSFTREDNCEEPVPNDTKEVPIEQAKPTYTRTLSGGVHSPIAIDHVPQKANLERIKSKSGSQSHQLGHNLSLKSSTGVSPRIRSVKNYPMELRMQALEMVELSPPRRHTNFNDSANTGLLSTSKL